MRLNANPLKNSRTSVGTNSKYARHAAGPQLCAAEANAASDGSTVIHSAP